MCFSCSVSRPVARLLSRAFLALSSVSIFVGPGLNFFAGEFSFSLSTLKGVNALVLLALPFGAELSSVVNEVNTGTLAVLVGEFIISETADVVECTALSISRYSGRGLYSKVLFSEVDPFPACDLLFFFTRNALGMISCRRFADLPVVA